MRKNLISVLLVMILYPMQASARSVSTPNSFTSGTTAVASQVNANFLEHESGIDDNDLRIDALHFSDSCTSPPCKLESGTIPTDVPIYYVETYGTDLAAINSALTACDAAADVSSSKPGIVMLPRGQTTIAVTGANTCPLIDMPETTNGSGDNRWASCQLWGWGMNPSQNDLANTSSGSTLYFTNPDSMADCTGSRDTIIRFGGYGQIFRDFAIAVDGTATTDYNNTRLMFLQSSARGAFAAGEYGVKAWEIQRVNFAADGSSGEGVGFESVFGIDGSIRDSWFQNFTVGYLPTSLAGTANNANVIENNRFAGNDDAVLIDDSLACQDMTLVANTIESNIRGVRLTNDATCHVTMVDNHFEQDTAGVQVGTHDVLLEGSAGSVTIIGGAMMGNITDANHIVFSAAQAAADTPTHVIQGVRFIDHDQVNFTAASGTRMIINEDFSRSSPLVPLAGANTNTTAAASTSFVQQEINGAGGTDLTCSSGSCDVDSAVTRDIELSAYTVDTTAPIDGTTACTEGDMYLDHTANKIYYCVDNATDDWFGVALTDAP